jgi:hypothetical protein
VVSEESILGRSSRINIRNLDLNCHQNSAFEKFLSFPLVQFSVYKKWVKVSASLPRRWNDFHFLNYRNFFRCGFEQVGFNSLDGEWQRCIIQNFPAERECDSIGGIGFRFGPYENPNRLNIHPLQQAGLLYIGLALNRLPSSKQKPYLKTTHDDQKEIRYPRSPIESVVQKRLLLVCDSYGRQAGEFYGVLFILSCYLCAMGIGGYGLHRLVDQRQLWSGGLLIGLALTLAAVGTLSGAFDCLPWHWSKCYQHTYYRQTFQHDGENVSQKFMDVIQSRNYASPIHTIVFGGRPVEMQMDHVWHTRVTVTCITIAAIFDAAEEALSHSPHLSEWFSDIGWIHYAPLAMLIIAGISWLTGRLRAPKKMLESEVSNTINDVKLHGGESSLLSFMEARAIELQSILEALWHHWNNAGEKLIHPLDARIDKLKNYSASEAKQLLDERRDFMVLYSHHLNTIKAEFPGFTSAVVGAGYPSSCEYHHVLANLKEHAEKIKNRSEEAWNKY